MAPKRRILIDCTPTFSFDILTGIQRVVRSVIVASKSIDTIEVVPVIFSKGKFIAVDVTHWHENKRTSTQQNFVLTALLSRMIRSGGFIAFKDWLRCNVGFLFSGLKNYYMRLMTRQAATGEMNQVHINASDLVLLLDAAWGRSDMPLMMSTIKLQRAKVYCVLYDLIPVLFPQYCHPDHEETFKLFIKQQLLSDADGVIAISQAVATDFQRYAQDNYPNFELPAVDYFHLGAEAKEFIENEIRQELVTFYKKNMPTFLMVSTIEPRKNHAYLLDVFEALWLSGVQVRLIFVGRIGWKVKALMQRIQIFQHRHDLFDVFYDLTDAELSYCYLNSSTLVFPSFAEGFGLPIIEALEHGLPVIVSDIAVHREIAVKYGMYINPYQPQDLVSLIESIVVNGVDPQYQPTDFKWLTWHESTQQLLTKVLAMAVESEQKA